ncbi:polyadenylate-binding protein 2 [Phanerochaete sordida]|uniref:Polyadenylate-binding protein 2 n=1 Tax=Phanerochaete sordida TaxID=48140 RepID=A0A9P3FYQ7_9APHY|nr:polyadenylate-binding protein 2 [Phanerochaete sordida]
MADDADTTATVAVQEATSIDDVEEEESKEILLMKQRVEEMEREANKLRELQAAAEKQEHEGDGGDASVPMETEDERAQADSRSIFIGNVDYAATPEEIQQHFQSCGTINRVTILCDKFTGHPKGFAYVEFADTESVDTALSMDNSLFRGRLIKVTSKRTNIHGFNRGRGRGGYRGGYRGGFRGGSYGYTPYGRGRGRGRGRGF